MKASEIREAFLKYFEEHGHQRVKSSSLIPSNDPTLLFTNAGMVQFKELFLGQEQRSYKRATTSQKCLRISGKHNDLENVGETARHHTFFEMLGNFSFGDYFKRDACRFAWNFLIDVIGLDQSRMWVSVYKDDDEAFDIWVNEVGVSRDMMVRLGEKDNYWSMGETGPQGPCSELIFDQGPGVGCKRPECDIYCDCDRHLELWNLVFMQYNKDDKGVVTPLPRPSIDTGMGLERIAAVKQGVHSNYETDLFEVIINKGSEISGVRYGAGPDSDKSLRVIADHARATAFLIADGELPSNSVRGYVLRRIMRRAARHGKLIGITDPFLYKVVDAVVDEMGDAYPDLVERRDYIEKVVRGEEERFLATLDRGMSLYREEAAKVKEAGAKTLPGEVVFKLYDTFGFPRDLTEIVARDDGLDIDVEGFESEMEAQRDRARTGSDLSAALGLNGDKMPDMSGLAERLGPTEFTGYAAMEGSAKIEALVVAGEESDSASGKGTPVLVFSKKSPFYAESGGQVGDKGVIKGANFEIEVQDTVKGPGDLIVHSGVIIDGAVKVGDDADFIVDSRLRRATMRHHTSTHLLQAALREVLGTHVHQRGSRVEPERFRFDFSHTGAMTQDEIRSVEDRVNEAILDNMEVSKTEMSYDEAKKAGAMALFGEKYGDVVRMVGIDDYSKELCGGTHVDRTGDIGLFKIVQETAIGSGERRIVGLAGRAALDYIREREEALDEAAACLKADDPCALADRVRKLQDEIRKLRKDLEKARTEGAGGGPDPMTRMKDINGVRVVSARVDVPDPKLLREMSDRILEKLGSGVVVLGAEVDGKANLVVKVSKDISGKHKAGDIIRHVAAMVGGRGGGRPEMAQAGGPDASKLDEALEAAYGMVG